MRYVVTGNDEFDSLITQDFPVRSWRLKERELGIQPSGSSTSHRYLHDPKKYPLAESHGGDYGLDSLAEVMIASSPS